MNMENPVYWHAGPLDIHMSISKQLGRSHCTPLKYLAMHKLSLVGPHMCTTIYVSGGSVPLDHQISIYAYGHNVFGYGYV